MSDTAKPPHMPREFRLIPRKPRAWPRYNSIANYHDDHDQADWNQLTLQHYDVTARGYFNRSFNMYRRSFDDYSVLFYCAFELRCAIERVFFEYLVHVTGSQLSKKAAKLWAANELQSALLESEPDFFWKIEFFNILAVARKKWRYVIPVKNMFRLLRDYGLLHTYLHAQKTKSDLLKSPLWWHTFRDLIESLHRYAWRYCGGAKIRITLDDRASVLLQTQKERTLTRQQLVDKIRRDEPDFEMNIVFRQFMP